MRLLSPPVLVLVLMTIVVMAASYYSHRRGFLRRDLHRDVLAIGVLALLAIGFFWRPIFEADAWIPYSGGDMASMLYPNYRFISTSLRHLDLPLWNPYLFCGEPFMADIQTGVLYPVNLAFWLLARPVTYQALEWLVVGHFFLAGATMYALLVSLPSLRGQRFSRLAALAGAVAYMFSDVFVTHIGNLNLIAVAAWLPLAFLLSYRAITFQRFGYAAAAGLTMGLAFLAGHVQPFLYIGAAVGLYGVAQLYWLSSTRDGRRRIPRLLAVLGLLALVTVGATLVQLLPSRELADLSVRSEITYGESAKFSLPLSQLVGLLIPGFFGRGPGDYWGQWLRTETGYVGVLTLVAGTLAVFVRRQRLVWFLAALAIIGLLLSLGGSTVLQGWLYELVPGFDKVRAPARFILLFDFAAAALCGFGVDVLVRPLRRVERRAVERLLRIIGVVAAFVGLVLVPASLFLIEANRDAHEQVLGRISGISDGLMLFLLLAVASFGLLLARRQGWLKRRTVGLLAVAIVALDLISLGHKVEVSSKDPTVGYNQQAVIDFLRSDGDVYRVDTDTNVWDVWQPNAAPLHGIQEVQGGQHPLVLADFTKYWSALGSRSTPMYDLLNVKYIVGRKGVPLDTSKWQLAFDDDPTFSVFRNLNFVPRAFVVNRAVVEPDHESQLAAMKQPGFDPRVSVVLESGQSLDGTQAASTASITTYRNAEVVVSVRSGGDGYLVLGDMYDKGWSATVDGVATPVLRADYTFRAVRVGAGEHTVRFSYEPLSWRIGGIVTGLTWLVVLGWGAAAMLRVRRARSDRRQPRTASDPAGAVT